MQRRHSEGVADGPASNEVLDSVDVLVKSVCCCRHKPPHERLFESPLLFFESLKLMSSYTFKCTRSRGQKNRNGRVQAVRASVPRERSLLQRPVSCSDVQCLPWLVVLYLLAGGWADSDVWVRVCCSVAISPQSIRVFDGPADSTNETALESLGAVPTGAG